MPQVPADVTDSSTWAPIAELAKHSEPYSWGFVFTDDDDICGIDLDHCRNSETGELTDWAMKLLREFPTYAEVSPSGTGVKVFLRGMMPVGARKRRSFDSWDSFGGVAQIEVYEEKRFFTVTGQRLDSTPCAVNDCEQSLQRLCAEYLTEDPASSHNTKSQCGTGRPTASNVLEQCRAASDAAKFVALWDGSTDGYPSQSEADLALCNLLAAFAGNNPRLIDDLFRQSGLFRTKWDEMHGRQTYGEMTIERSLTERQRNPFDKRTSDQPESQATLLVNLALKHELWHSRVGQAFVTIDRREHIRIGTKRFNHWLRQLAYSELRRSVSKQVIADATAQIESLALFEGLEHQDHLRTAFHNDCIYIDLCNEQWQAVEVTGTGWRVIDNPPVRLRRTEAMQSLPIPMRGGSLEPLRELLNVSATTWPLFVSWVLAAMRPTGPYPVLSFFGESGTTKSTTSRVARKLVDPNQSPLRGSVRQQQDLMIAANNNWILAFDNLSGLQGWLSDALCCLSTAGGFGARQLYTDQDEVVFDAMRPVILNGISEVATRGDLVDRVLLIELETIEEAERLTEDEFWSKFDLMHASVFGALLDALVAALDRLPSVSVTARPRMADFALWATAAEESIGLEPGGFMVAYDANRSDANRGVLEDSPIGRHIVALASLHEEGIWEGTSTELLHHLENEASDQDKRHRHWPKAPNTLSKRLREIATNLRQQGIEVEQRWHGRGNDKRRLIVLRRMSS
jgi:hypothetical protein